MKNSDPPAPLDSEGRERRRSQRLALRVPVFIQGKSREGKTIEVAGHTLAVNAHGALIEIPFEPEETKYLVLHNATTNQRQACRLVWSRRDESGMWHCGVEFATPAPHFWGVDFPPDDWNLA